MPARRKPPELRVVETNDANPTGEARPIVRIVAGRRSEAIDEAEIYLADRDLDLFRRGEFVVRVAPQHVEIAGGGEALVLRVTRVKSKRSVRSASR